MKEQKKLMELHKEWTLKLATSARVTTPSYQVLIHEMPKSFQPDDPDPLRELQKANELYIQGIKIQRSTWLKNNKQPGKNAGSIILWISQAEHADKAISKGIMWKCQLKTTEIFRLGF